MLISLTSGDFWFSCTDIGFVSESDPVLEGYCTGRNGAQDYNKLDIGKRLDTRFMLY